MANPDSVPAEKYGKSALEKLGVWASVEKQVARAKSTAAKPLLEYLRSAPARSIWEKYGFGLAQ